MSRKSALAKIHIAKKDLGLSDEVYRGIIEAKFGESSAKDLTESQLEQLAGHLRTLGWEPEPPKKKGSKPRNMSGTPRAPLLSKIEAYLAEAGRPWQYADGVAKRVCGVDRVQWCTPNQLQKVVAALGYNAKRHGRRA